MNTANTSSEGIAAEESRARIVTVRAALENLSRRPDRLWRLLARRQRHLLHQFRPLDGVSDIANAVLLLGVDADPVLFVSDQCLDYARSVTLFEVRSLHELTDAVGTLAKRRGRGDLRAPPTSPQSSSTASRPASAIFPSGRARCWLRSRRSRARPRWR
ncbi:MAG: hypothetical protein M3Y41_13335 [Pseudomonadota bacterium]|nr:hypothetical protein [Pseudomonadota bacterium]